MTVDLATIGLEFRTDGMVKGRTELDRTAASANKAADAVDKTGKSAESADRGFSSWANTLKGLALGAIITQSIRTADALNQVNSRLSLVTKSTTELTQVQRQLFQLSQQNRSDFAATADLYTALARSTKDLGVTQEQLLRITGTFGKALIVSGGSAQSAQAAITQFNQAMASGVLRGEEFNSISEQAPRIMDLLASSLGKTRGELRQLAQDGKLTSDVVLPAILKGAKDVEAEFARMPVTVAQAGQVLQNSLGQAVLAIDNATGSTSTLAGAVVDLATILDSVTASMGGVNKETQKAGILQNGLAVVFETVAVLAANTAFVLKGIGNELGAIGAQVGAVLRGDFAQAAEIGRLAKLDAEAARAQIDATTRNILNARQRAQDLKDVAGITDAQSRRMAALTDTIKAGTKATNDNTKAKKAKREESVKVADAIRDEERAMFALLEGEEKYRRLQDSRIEAADEMLQSIEFETRLLTMNTQERAIATAQRELERKGIVAGTEAYDEYIQKIRQAVINREATQSSIDRIKEINEEGKRFAADLERGLTDSLFRAFEAGKGFFSTLWDGIKNLFKTTVLKAIIQPVVGGVTGALGLTSAANAGGIDSVFSTASNVASIANLTTSVGSLVTIGSQVASGAMSVANALGTVFANSTGTGISGLLATNGAFGTAAAGSTAGAASSALSSAAAAGPYVLAAVAALNALGVFRSRKIVDGGLQGELGGQINDFALERKGGTLFSGPSYRVLDRGVSAQNEELQRAYGAIRDTVAGMAEQLGIGNDAIKSFTVQLGNDLIHPDTGGFGIKTQGLTQDEIIAKIEAALVSANEQLAAFALGTEEYTREGESASQTLARLVGALNTVNGVFDALGLALIDVSKAAPDAAQQFIDLFGGAEQFATVANSYYQNFYTEAERTAATVEGLRQRFFELGTAGATTREEFKALVEEQQRLHGATSPVVAELLKLSDTFASVVPAIEAVTDATAALTSQASVEQFDRTGSLQAVRDYDAQQLEIQRINQENATKAYQLEQLATGQVVNTEAGVRSLISILAELGDASQITAEQVANAAVQAGATGSVARGQFGILSENFQSSEQRVEGLFPLDSAGNFTATPEDLFVEQSNLRRITEFLVKNASDEVAIFLDQVSQSTSTAEEKLLALNATLENFTEIANSANTPIGLDAANESLNGLKDAIAELSKEAEVAVDATAILREKQSLELRILQLQGNTAELRRLELAALDPSNRSLQEFIYLLEDQARLEADATRLADAFGSIRDSVRSLIDGLLIDSQRSILSPSQILGEAERQYRMNLAGAFEGDTQAAGRLGGSVNNLLDAARNNATNEVDYNRTFGRTLGDLNGLESFATRQATTEDVVAELRSVRQELAAVRSELNAQRTDSQIGMAAMAKNTGDTAGILRRWEGDGLPETRDTDGTTVVIGA